MDGWHHRLNGHEFEQTLGDGQGQGSLACCSPWGNKELDMTEQLDTASIQKKHQLIFNIVSSVLLDSSFEIFKNI